MLTGGLPRLRAAGSKGHFTESLLSWEEVRDTRLSRQRLVAGLDLSPDDVAVNGVSRGRIRCVVSTCW